MNIESASRDERARELERARHREGRILGALAEISRSTSLIAHEIKNATSAVHLALRVVASALEEDEEAVLADLVQRLRNVEHSIRGALDHATPLEPSPEACDASALVEDALASVQQTLADAAIRLEARILPETLRLRVDPELLGAALRELVENAARAVVTGGRVELTIQADADGLTLRVDDAGPGFSEQARTTLFEPFATRRCDGSGMGLARCRRIAEAHGGTIAAVTGDLGGACVEIALPPSALEKS